MLRCLSRATSHFQRVYKVNVTTLTKEKIFLASPKTTQVRVQLKGSTQGERIQGTNNGEDTCVGSSSDKAKEEENSSSDMGQLNTS